MSLIRMAEMTGIGKVGKNGLLFHSLYGPRLMLGGVLTTAALPTFAWPEKDTKGCPAGCFVCQDVCPAGAIDRKGKVNGPSCNRSSMKTPLLSFMLKSQQFGHDDMPTLLNTACVDGNSMYTCVKCVSECPAC